MPKLVKWQDLNRVQQADVLCRFPYWNHPSPLTTALLAAGWTKQKWAAAHSFYVRRDGQLADRPGYAVPQILGPDPSAEAQEMQRMLQILQGAINAELQQAAATLTPLTDQAVQAFEALGRAVAGIKLDQAPGGKDPCAPTS